MVDKKSWCGLYAFITPEPVHDLVFYMQGIFSSSSCQPIWPAIPGVENDTQAKLPIRSAYLSTALHIEASFDVEGGED